MREEWRPLVGYEGRYEVSNMGRIKSLERTVWNEKEIWRPVVGYEGLYEVSNMGNVKSLNYRRTGKEKIMKLNKDSNSYLQVKLWKDGKRKRYLVHRLVATAFIPNPNNLPVINHKNEIKSDNRVSNLEWCSYSYNLSYNDRAKKVGKKVAEKLTNNPKLSKPVIAIHKINGLILKFPSIREAGRSTGIPHQSIYKCCKGAYKSAGGFVWHYADTEE